VKGSPRALLFDLDGTLVDSRRDIAEAANASRIHYGLSPLRVESIYPMIGDGARALVARAFDFSKDDHGHGAPPPDTPETRLRTLRASRSASVDLDGALATFSKAYAEKPCVHTTLMPGAREALATGLPNALVTNKPRALTMLVLESLGIASSFAAVWGGDEGPLKPDPSGILAVCAKLGVAPRDAWVIGDGPQDIGAGKAAGCFTVAVPGIAERELVLRAAPDLVVDSLYDVARRAST
jgi:phosphoglycolate phosphatase